MSPLARSRVRVEYVKGEEVRFTSHLDLGKIFERAVRRSGLPIAYSQGYHPRQKLSFGPPLPLGFTGQREYLDLYLSRPFSGDVTFCLNRVLPTGIQVNQSRSILSKADSLSSIIAWAEYHVALTDQLEGPARHGLDDLMEKGSLIIQRVTKRGPEDVDIRPFIRRISIDQGKNTVCLLLSVGSLGYVKPQEIFKEAFGLTNEEIALLHIERVGLYAEREGELISPMEAV